MHVRWELYPVPHEKGKADHGGSFLEDVDWWTKPIPKSKTSELMAMGEEIILLKGVFESNKPLWIWTLPFHLGLYLIVISVGLLVVGAIAQNITGTSLLDGTGFWRFCGARKRASLPLGSSRTRKRRSRPSAVGC